MTGSRRPGDDRGPRPRRISGYFEPIAVKVPPGSRLCWRIARSGGRGVPSITLRERFDSREEPSCPSHAGTFSGSGATISPGSYFTIGFLLTLLKQGLDRIVATRFFGKPWSPLSYAVTGEIGGLFSLDRDDQIFYATMLAVALPFLVVGVVLTVRRLRDANWPLWLSVLFFAPMPINIVFFVVLCLVPSVTRAAQEPMSDLIDGPEGEKSQSRDARPRFSFKRAMLAILLPLPVAAAVVYVGVYVLRDYGWSLFVGLPFVLPMLSVVIYGYGRAVTTRRVLQAWLALAPDGDRAVGCDRL